jgi:N-methylhydantoinase A/oxoprolinase/acetone carboxylase beta subunit
MQHSKSIYILTFLQRGFASHILPSSPPHRVVRRFSYDFIQYTITTFLVLCAFGDAITALRHEAGRTYICKLVDVTASEVIDTCKTLANQASEVLEKQGVLPSRQSHTFEADMRYSGQALSLPVGFALEDLERDGLEVLERR